MHSATQEAQVHMLLLYSTTTPLEKKAEEFSQVLPRCKVKKNLVFNWGEGGLVSYTPSGVESTSETSVTS